MSYDVRRLPIIGGEFAKIGQIYDILVMPCTPTAWIWVQAFWTGIPKAVWSIVKPDPLDYVQERFGRPHHRKRKRKFQIADIMESKIPVKNGLGWAAFAGTELLQRIGWYLLIVDTATEFIYNWTSMAYLWDGCRIPNAKYAQQSVKDQLAGPPAAGDYIFGTWHLDAVNGLAANSSYVVVLPGDAYSVAVSISGAKQRFGPPYGIPTAVNIVDLLSGQKLAALDYYQFDDGSHTFSGVWHPYFPNSTQKHIAVQISKPAGYWQATSGVFNVQTQPSPLLLPDP